VEDAGYSISSIFCMFVCLYVLHDSETTEMSVEMIIFIVCFFVVLSSPTNPTYSLRLDNVVPMVARPPQTLQLIAPVSDPVNSSST